MKKDIHPQYHKESQVNCACGNAFTVGSTLESIQVEICSSCHPFYTGKTKLVDSARRVDKFQKRVAKKAEATSVRTSKKAKKEKQKKIQASKKTKVDQE